MRDFIPRMALVASALLAIGAGAAADNTTTSYQDPAADVTYVRIAPPAPLTEAGATAVSDAQVWIPGHWAWQQGAFTWRPGSAVPKPTPTARWQPGAWEHVATRHHGWRYRAGRWVI